MTIVSAFGIQTSLTRKRIITLAIRLVLIIIGTVTATIAIDRLTFGCAVALRAEPSSLAETLFIHALAMRRTHLNCTLTTLAERPGEGARAYTGPDGGCIEVIGVHLTRDEGLFWLLHQLANTIASTNTLFVT